MTRLKAAVVIAVVGIAVIGAGAYRVHATIGLTNAASIALNLVLQAPGR
jgi:hypothetical protein